MIDKILLLAGAFGIGIYIATKTKTAQAATVNDMGTSNSAGPIPPEIASQNISQMGVSPEGFKPATGSVPPNVVNKCVTMLNQPYGTEEYITGTNGKEYFIRVEPHSWYGADPSKKPKWHVGTSVYIKV
jgi:hypothetical protein